MWDRITKSNRCPDGRPSAWLGGIGERAGAIFAGMCRPQPMGSLEEVWADILAL